MIFDRESWERICKGFFVQDCTIGFEHGRLGFQLVEESNADHLEEWRTRFLAVKLDEPMEFRFFSQTGNNLSFAQMATSWAPSQTEFLLVDTFRNVLSYKPKTYKSEEPVIPFDGRGYGYADAGKVGSAIIRLARVGTTVYAIGAPLRIFQRMPNQKWFEHKGIPMPAGLKSKDDDIVAAALRGSNLYDLAGFSESDMYAVGDDGIVWHFNGKIWKQLAFPSNLRLQTVVCAGDGNVYITDIRGSLWKGRNESWKKIVTADMSIPFADSAWFAGRLWCAHDYGMWVVEGKEFVAAHMAISNPIPSNVALHAHRIDVSPDGTKMLVCGGHGAAMYDGKKWEILFSGFDFE